MLVVCGGVRDETVLNALGFSNFVVSTMRTAYTPDRFVHADAQALPFESGAFDHVLVHDGLHHCSIPHLALSEMYRVARRSVWVFENQDSIVVRAAARLGFALRYEIDAVATNHGTFGGVDNSAVPNHVYRWTKREFLKTVRSMDPALDVPIEFSTGFEFHSVHLSGFLAGHSVTKALGQRAFLRLARIGTWVANAMVPSLGNSFIAVVRKDLGRPMPWLEGGSGEWRLRRDLIRRADA